MRCTLLRIVVLQSKGILEIPEYKGNISMTPSVNFIKYRDEDEFPDPIIDDSDSFEIETCHSKLSPTELEEFRKFIKGWQEKFQGLSGISKAAPMKLCVDPNQPHIRQKPYPLSPAMQKVARELVDDMLAKGLVSRSESPWASPAFVIPKKNGQFRFM